MTDLMKPPETQEDNLAQDLIKILTEAALPPQVQQTVLDKLVPYLVERDHRILQHGYQSGRASA